MHKYFVEIFKYTESGSLEDRAFTTMTADNELQLRKIRDQYAYEMQTKTDPETGETVKTNLKAYKVRAYKICYKVIANLDAEIASAFDLTM